MRHRAFTQAQHSCRGNRTRTMAVLQIHLEVLRLKALKRSESNRTMCLQALFSVRYKLNLPLQQLCSSTFLRFAIVTQLSVKFTYIFSLTSVHWKDKHRMKLLHTTRKFHLKKTPKQNRKFSEYKSSIFWLVGRRRCYLQVDCFGSDSMLFWKVCCSKYKPRSLVIWGRV